MSTLPTPNPTPYATGADWRHCAGCDDLFPTLPDQLHCRRCLPPPPPGRCEATHPDDRSPCEYPRDAVRVADQDGNQVYGCVHHASVALASIDGACAYTGSVAGAGAETYRRARLCTPFPCDPAGPAALDRVDGWE